MLNKRKIVEENERVLMGLLKREGLPRPAVEYFDRVWRRCEDELGEKKLWPEIEVKHLITREIWYKEFMAKANAL